MASPPSRRPPAPTRRHGLVLFALLALLCALASLAGCDDVAPLASNTLAEARKAFADGSFLQAEELYESYLREQPEGQDRLEAWERVLDVAWNIRDDKPKAAGLLEAMHLEYGERSDLTLDFLRRLSEVYVAMNKMDKAADTLHKALNIKGLGSRDRVDILLGLARIYRSQSQYDLALEALGQCHEQATSDQDKARCLMDQSLIFGFMQSYDRARESLDKLFALSGLDEGLRSQAVFFEAELLERQGKLDEAIELLEGIRQSYPNRMALEERLDYLRGQKAQ